MSKTVPSLEEELPPRQGDPGNLLKIVQKGYIAPFFEKNREISALPMSDFEGKKAVWLQRSVGLGDKTAIDFKTPGTRKKRLCRLEVADLGMKFRPVALRDIRRVADDGIEGSGLVFCRKRG